MNRSAKIGILVALLAAAVFCGYFMGRRPATPPGVTKGQAGKNNYTCAMHPFVLKDQPGPCPVCGMEMVLKIGGPNLSDKEAGAVRQVALSPSQQIMANLATVAATVKPFNREISCTGIVAYNQERQGKVSTWLSGRLDNLIVKSVGSEVRKGQAVAEIFSIDLYNAQVQYLLAYKTIKVLNSSTFTSFPINTQLSLGDAYERLRQLGFREEQFARLQKSDKPTITVPISSPFSGVVTEKLVREGQYVNVGEALFSIADLSQIWVELELFESDFPLVKVGQEVTIHSRSYPGDPFRGKVKLIYPFLDAKTRTVKLRVELPNPGLKLKPEMYVQASIKVPLADSLVIPARAVMDTGARQLVWVESKPGVFAPRNVKTGTRSGKEVQILSGLKAGEKVASTGGFLIDSEAQLSRGAEPSSAPAESTAPR
ncbi:MAG: efflux RND transporter periplasmic adaptor subunit [Desulfuromonadales bacterium]|nr:efflux RND transporter periplasmic adaptor subunit [Desulfuromonadales bacterium]